MKIKLPQPKKFAITYRNTKGQIRSHQISTPITATPGLITSYCFGQNRIKSFKLNSIIDLEEIS